MVISTAADRNKALPRVSPDLAHQCLLSMPFDSRRAAAYITEVKKVLQWHSTLDTLKNPPSGYLSPAVDLLGGLDFIRQKALKKEFSSQFEFDTALQRLLSSANDGHLGLETCSQQIFLFENANPIVSVSSDGLEIPEIYDFQDIHLLSNRSDLVSPIASIDDKDAQKYIEELSHLLLYQDPDARWNMAFDSLTRVPTTNAFLGAWTGNQGFWQGRAVHEIKFANGTEKKVPVIAVPQLKFGFNYTDSRTLFKDYCLPSPSSDDDEEEETTTSPIRPASPYLPKAIVRDEYNLISGYFPEDKEWDDLAVLLVPSFATGDTSPEEPLAFANNATKFLHEAKKAGKKKIIIDLSNNAGGTVVSGLDLFKAFFPEKDIYSASRLRAHEGFNLIGKALRNLKRGTILYEESNFSLQSFVKPDQKHGFESWKNLYGPHELLGSNLTSLVSVMNFTEGSDWDFPIRGYGLVKQNETEAPFAPEDILLLTDGLCTSTCTIFAELMKNTAGVKSITFGGRPQQGPMQAIGGSKGCQVATSFNINALRDVADQVANLADAEGKPVLTRQEHARLNATLPGDMPLNPDGKISFNLRNSYREGDDEMPLQFLYEPADCRLFYTPENILHPDTTWISAAKAFWGNGTCVTGSYSTVNQTEWSA
ncbi:peptidase S41 family protein [Aspergillus steynii IBT 23096]|uniref:Peptidase S41 family protein n=1 Tax=Aspergillus steynii IBT 23096 TaxID=1392250 RepID=A0A2I2GF81_9EURO|nr:peptidase S41 family protein [Aspergillus steynii IBT 23096]PLB51538.1 peptidase S41 family protein [Aspergillus steynii IBT 23096]